MSVRQPARLMDISRLAEAYPLELLADFETGNFTLKTSSGGTVEHKKPGTLTVKQGSSILLNTTDLFENIELTIPEFPTSISGNAETATKLATARNIGLTGVTAVSQSFDGSGDINIPITAIPSSLLTGTIDLSLIPAGALERMVIVDDSSARFALTSEEVQQGDVVKETDTGLMYYVKDANNLNSEDGYEVYTAGYASSVPWAGITNKPSFATVATSGQYSDLIGAPVLSSVATSGSYNDLTDLPTIYQPSSTTPLVAGTASIGTSDTFARADHVHPLQTSVSGNAGTATKLATARTLTIGNTGKSFDGSVNVSWSLSEIGAAATSHDHLGQTISPKSIELNSDGSMVNYGGCIDFHHSSNYTADYTSRIIETSAGLLNINGITVTNGGTLKVTNATGILKVYTGTLSTAWSGSAAPYIQVVTVSGILATDKPIMDYTNSGTYATDKSREDGWSNIYRILTDANRLTFYAHAKPTVSIPFVALVTR